MTESIEATRGRRRSEADLPGFRQPDLCGDSR